MSHQAVRVSTALLFSTIVLLATAIASSAQNFPGPALPAPALASDFFSMQIATSSALPNAMAATLGWAAIYSTDGGVAWKTVRQGPWGGGDVPWTAIVPRADPAAPVRVVVAATYLEIDRTGDYGQTWARAFLPPPPNATPDSCCRNGTPLVVSPVDPNRLYAMYIQTPPPAMAPPDQRLVSSDDVKFSIYTSGDGGVNWQLILYGDGAPDISPSPVLAGRVYVGNKRSDNAGATWVDQPWTPYDLLALDANNANLLYRLSVTNVGIGQGLRSADGGATWSAWAQQPCGGYYQLMAHPTLSNVLFLRCDSRLWRSRNGGDSWQALSVAGGELLAPDYGQLGRLLWARGDGLWASTDEGTHWTNLTPDYMRPLPVGWLSRLKPSSFASECDTCDLNAVTALSQDDAWAVGEQGMIVHWDGNEWAKVSSPVTITLNSISMVSATDGWAVGDQGTILRWNGSTWVKANSPALRMLNSVSMISATEGWAVGDNFPNHPQSALVHWNGSTWSQVPLPVDVAMWSVLMLSPTDGWAAGWRDYLAGNVTTVMLHWNGTQWAETNAGQCRYPISLASVSTNSVWAVQFWSPAICRWNGSAWSLFPVPDIFPPNTLVSIAMASPNEGWAAGGDGRTLHWDGSTWTDLLTYPTDRGLASITMLDAKHGWMVGQNGIILDRIPPSVFLPGLVK